MPRHPKPLTQTEEDQTRAIHNSDNSLHAKAGCKVCRLLHMLDLERENHDATRDALKDALRGVA